ncbi:YfhD family protein [Lysinibacillus odysseyi]|uniref:YfhD family protein n=1 Tax=Lysinibacillus odysseyi TaxID=202611 RepID=UPI000A52D624|nr:YfhD family protein [Lysinibacillus odysseyi]
MGRDDKKGSSHNKDTLPQTPKNEKISPNKIREEFSKELVEIAKSASRQRHKK